MIYRFSLSAVAVVTGILYIVFHVWAAIQPKQFASFAKAFPRHNLIGYLLMGGSAAWILWLCTNMDLGEFSPMRQQITFFFAALGAMSLWLLTEFMAVRGLAILLLLGANVLLDGAFLSDNPLKLFITVLAYIWIVSGIILICSPYLLRDGLTWVSERDGRIRLLAWPGAIFGGILLLLGALVY